MSKIKTKITLLCILMLLLVSFVTANVEIVENEIGLEVDYNDFKDEDWDDITVTTNTITLKNDGTENLTVTLNAARFTCRLYSYRERCYH